MISLHEQYVTDATGSTTGVLIAKDEYDRLVEYIEELEDITAYREEKAKGEQPTFKWKDVKRL
ncbi:MAG: hypothetical protein JXK07_11630 [Spirochaetes bacterium]|nr:hypothetical protein [Spirochaetota bacterium]MBN2769884.1 hypothetical protein [Spirochaetota bacterium]